MRGRRDPSYPHRQDRPPCPRTTGGRWRPAEGAPSTPLIAGPTPESRVLNPDRIPGRLTLVTRMGAADVERALPPLLAAVREAGHPVVWACDPMHGNTFTSTGGRKTRHLDDVLAEIAGFFAAHRSEGTWPGGVHVELTGDDVTECLGGAEEILDSHLDQRYETMCDPRLNARQSLDLAFRVAELLRG
ncbi:MAG: 3-deoxy-7-phosphoheptulonate synthase [Actinobacteria bacterium]|nr:3-deoxy-7-phosphoheptulonate synthase [Actinomycetota bacterium]